MLAFLNRWRMARFEARHPFPEADWQVARGRVPLLGVLPDDPAGRLGRRAWYFLHHKRISLHPALREEGIEFDTAGYLALAGQACLLTLGWRDRDHLDAFANVHEILVLPEAFHRRVEEMDEFGVMHEYDDQRAGETSHQGPVVVAYPDLMASGGLDGFNVLIHELSHKLDMGNSLDADGYPPLPGDMDPRQWYRVFMAVWEDLQARLERGDITPIDDYAATHPGECFAVNCEYFFTSPHTLVAAYPELYTLLTQYFRQEPAGWFGPRA
ncbi:zinc-dependent peptidase [Halomonas halmophila]|uniref:Protein MtfA n=1 Tax=Halomonas halmophila TaxID=252 RepID=A0A4Y4F165_9GAMM|nr:M90 family metallopeptidase [Halomonas halmophila]GED22385.1 hypothetical protein HHA01_13620 [Halomonas halmophila]